MTDLRYFFFEGVFFAPPDLVAAAVVFFGPIVFVGVLGEAVAAALSPASRIDSSASSTGGVSAASGGGLPAPGSGVTGSFFLPNFNHENNLAIEKLLWAGANSRR